MLYYPSKYLIQIIVFVIEHVLAHLCSLKVSEKERTYIR